MGIGFPLGSINQLAMSSLMQPYAAAVRQTYSGTRYSKKTITILIITFIRLRVSTLYGVERFYDGIITIPF